jgi:hypothetical protein
MVEGLESHHVPEPTELLAEELNRLSFNERERVFSDVHGVSAVVEETPELIAESLFGIESALASSTAEKKAAYEQAKHMEPDYISNLNFQLKFLRADNFDTAKAADRMIKYLDRKLGLFGSDKLTKKITLDDFSAEDMEVAQSGLGSILPLRDMAGRLLLCWMPMLRGDSSLVSRVSFENRFHDEYNGVDPTY